MALSVPAPLPGRIVIIDREPVAAPDVAGLPPANFRRPSGANGVDIDPVTLQFF
jgi:hypothetical protein